jgi:hypothetical protein
MAIAFGQGPDSGVILPSERLLNAIRTWVPGVAQGYFPKSEGNAFGNKRILDALERTVPMNFPKETPLDDILKYVRQETQLGNWELPIYVDPVGLQEAERSLTSTVTLDLTGVPLKTTMHLILSQLGLGYSVRDGFLFVTSAVEVAPAYDYQDPYLTVGHCVMALLAAALGGLLAPFVSDIRRFPNGNEN